MTTTASEVYSDVVYYMNSIFFNPELFMCHFEKYFDMFLLGFRRKLTALALCKSIESAIQWFQIHHRITFATIQNLAAYLSGARVSIFSTLVPRLLRMRGTWLEPHLRQGRIMLNASVCEMYVKVSELSFLLSKCKLRTITMQGLTLERNTPFTMHNHMYIIYIPVTGA